MTDEWIELSNGTTVTPGHRYLQTDGSFEEIGKMLEAGGGECEVVLADGSLQKVTGERIVYSAETAHLYEESEKVVYENFGGLALEPKIVKGWKTYNFTVEKYHTYIADGVRVHNDSILSRVEPDDQLVALSGDLDDAAIIRDGKLVILDGFDFGETTDTFLNLTYEFTPNSAQPVEDIVAGIIAGETTLAGRPVDEDGIVGNDLYTALEANGAGTWQTFFRGVKVPSVADLLVAAASNIFNPLGGIQDALAPLLTELTGEAKVEIGYSLGDGDVTLTPQPIDLTDALLTLLGVDSSTSIAPGITVGSIISSVGLPTALGETELTFGPGIAEGDVQVFQSGDDLRFVISPLGEVPSELIVTGANDSGNPISIETLSFADGQSIPLPGFTDPTPPAVNGTVGDDTLNGGTEDDEIFAGDGDDVVYGNDGNDVLYGEGGRDILWGGDGDDILNAGSNDNDILEALRGQDGNDTYIYSTESRNVFINNQGESAETGANDRVILTDLNLADLTILERTQDNANGTSVRLDWDGGHLRIANEGQHIETIEFADGLELTSLNLDSLDRVVAFGTSGDDTITGTAQTNRLYGGDGNDTLDAGLRDAGNLQYLYGEDGDDTYLYSKASGRVFINSVGENGETGTNDRVVFSDLNATDISISYTTQMNANNTSILLNWADDTGTGHLRIANEGQHIESFEFADGTVITEFAAPGTSGDDVLTGTSLNDVIFAGDGDDEVSGLGGDDTLFGGNGDDDLFGGAGDDTLDAGANDSGGVERLFGQLGNDTYLYSTTSRDVFITNAGENTNTGTDDRVIFDDLNLADLTITENAQSTSINGISVFLNWEDGSDNGYLRIANKGDSIETIEFADGLELTSLNLDDSDRVRAVATSGNDVIIGTDQTDLIYAGAGDDTLDAGQRDGTKLQYLFGQAGNDTYQYSKASGRVFINSLAENDGSGTADRVVFTDLNYDDVTVSFNNQSNANGNSIVLNWNDGTDSGYLRIANEGQHIESFVFADGTVVADLVGQTINDGDTSSSINGTTGDDDISGNGGSDTIDGGFGDDLITGGTGNDTLLGGEGDDEIFGGGGVDTLTGGAGDDVLDGGTNANDTAVFTGARADYTVTTNADGSFSIFSVAEGSDTLINIEFVQFSDGTFTPADLVVLPTVGEAIVGTDSSETLTGTSNDDTISGYGAADTLRGLAGDDVLDGGQGNDTLIGGAGNDTLRGSDGSDTLTGSNGDDTLIGGKGADFLYGNADSDILDGGNGGDVLNGGTGNDILTGGSGNDQIDGGSGNADLAVFSGASGNYTFLDNQDGTYQVSNGGEGTDTLTSIENVQFSDGTFVLTDLVPPPAPPNVIDGTTGNETLVGTSGIDIINGFGGADTLSGLAGNDIITAGNGIGTLYGGSGNDVLTAGNGINILDGGAGADILSSGSGFADLYGGDGADRFVYQEGFHEIFDFSSIEGDSIEIDRSDVNDWADLQAVIASSGSSNTLEFGTSDELTLTGVNINSLQESDFIFV